MFKKKKFMRIVIFFIALLAANAQFLFCAVTREKTESGINTIQEKPDINNSGSMGPIEPGKPSETDKTDETDQADDDICPDEDIPKPEFKEPSAAIVYLRYYGLKLVYFFLSIKENLVGK